MSRKKPNHLSTTQLCINLRTRFLTFGSASPTFHQTHRGHRRHRTLSHILHGRLSRCFHIDCRVPYCTKLRSQLLTSSCLKRLTKRSRWAFQLSGVSAKKRVENATGKLLGFPSRSPLRPIRIAINPFHQTHEYQA